MMRYRLAFLLITLASQVHGQETCGTICDLTYWKSGPSQAEVLNLIDTLKDVDARHEYGWTALAAAASAGNSEAVAALLGRGADPNAIDDFGSSPLFAAAFAEQPNIVKMLIDAGADVGHINNDGQSLQQLAQESGNPDVLGALSGSPVIAAASPSQPTPAANAGPKTDFSALWPVSSEAVDFGLKCKIKISNLPADAEAFFAISDNDPVKFERQGVDFEVFFLSKEIKFPDEDFGTTPAERWAVPAKVPRGAAVFFTTDDDAYFSGAYARIEASTETYQAFSYEYGIGDYEFWSASINRQTGGLNYSRNVRLGDGWSDIYEISSDNGRCEKMSDSLAEERFLDRWDAMNTRITEYNSTFLADRAADKAAEDEKVKEQKF
jgi:hypothetical protein